MEIACPNASYSRALKILDCYGLSHFEIVDKLHE